MPSPFLGQVPPPLAPRIVSQFSVFLHVPPHFNRFIDLSPIDAGEIAKELTGSSQTDFSASQSLPGSPVDQDLPSEEEETPPKPAKVKVEPSQSRPPRPRPIKSRGIPPVVSFSHRTSANISVEDPILESPATPVARAGRSANKGKGKQRQASPTPSIEITSGPTRATTLAELKGRIPIIKPVELTAAAAALSTARVVCALSFVLILLLAIPDLIVTGCADVY